MSGDRRSSSVFEVYQLHCDASLLTFYVVGILLRNVVEYLLAIFCPFTVSDVEIVFLGLRK